MTASEAVSLAGFARLLGCQRSAVTALKKADRLVLNAEGNVLVSESFARIEATRDPSKAAVVARHAATRGAGLAQNSVGKGEAAGGGEDNDDVPEGMVVDQKIDQGYQTSRAKREHYQALAAQRDYEVSIGKLMDAAEVASAVASATTQLRSRLEGLPDVLGPQLAAVKDEAQARAMLAEAIEHALEETSRRFAALAKQPTE